MAPVHAKLLCNYCLESHTPFLQQFKDAPGTALFAASTARIPGENLHH